MAFVRFSSGIHTPLRFYTRNPLLHLDNRIPASFPYLSEMAPGPTHRSKISVDTMYLLSTAIWTLYPGFS